MTIHTKEMFGCVENEKVVISFAISSIAIAIAIAVMYILRLRFVQLNMLFFRGNYLLDIHLS